MAFNRVDHIGIVVADFEKACAFVRDVLELKEVRKAEENVRAAFFRIGDLDLQIVEDKTRLGSSKVGRLEHVCLFVDSIEEATAALTAGGMTMLFDKPETVKRRKGRTTHTTESGPLGIRLQISDANA